MISFPRSCFARAFFLAVALCMQALVQSACAGAKPPVTWIDPDTKHRVWRLTDEPNSSGLYFNLNACTPDRKTLVYTAPGGIYVVDLATKKTRLLIADGTGEKHVSVINAGFKSNSVFVTRPEPNEKAGRRIRAIWKIDVYSGRMTKLAVLPAGTGTPSINADESLAAGTCDEGPVDPSLEYGFNPKAPVGADGKPLVGSLVRPANKNQMMMRRFAAHIPLLLFTIDLKTGKTTTLLHTTDWLDHLLFSPTDASLLMYGHQGPWQSLDPLWLIRTDGTENSNVEKRRMAMEIAGHAFWAADGGTMWYDLQTPIGVDYWLAGFNPKSHLRTWYHLQRGDWCLHYNVSSDGRLFCGDGGDPGPDRGQGSKWIELFRPESVRINGVNQPDFIQPGVLHSERLVNMSRHDYRLEPNARFTPDGKMVIFTSNMFGPGYVFGVEVNKL